MPELPEVETLARDLRATVVGRTITEARVSPDAPRLVQRMPVDAFTSPQVGDSRRSYAQGDRMVASTKPSERSPQDDKAKGGSKAKARGDLKVAATGQPRRSPKEESIDMWWVAHRRMSGNFVRRPQDAPDEPFIRARFRLDDGNELRFVDLRKFGTMCLVDDPEPLLRGLGPEPLDVSFTVETLAAILARRSAPVKSVLLDQAAIAGVGNLYADEALHYAKVHPLRVASGLTKDEVARLREGIVGALEQGLRNLGSSVGYANGEEISLRDHVNLDGKPGSNQEYLVAYGREGRPCRNCGTAIERLKIGNRSAHYCPACQKRGRARSRSKPEATKSNRVARKASRGQG